MNDIKGTVFSICIIILSVSFLKKILPEKADRRLIDIISVMIVAVFVFQSGKIDLKALKNDLSGEQIITGSIEQEEMIISEYKRQLENKITECVKEICPDAQVNIQIQDSKINITILSCPNDRKDEITIKLNELIASDKNITFGE